MAVSAGGTVNPGVTIGTLTTSSMSLNGTLSIDLNDSDPGIQDVLNVTGNLALSAATLNLNITGSLTQPAYIIGHYGSLTGNPFATFTGTPGNYKVDYNYLNGNQIALVSAPALLQGDYDRNGVFNKSDIAAMLNALTDLNGYKSQNTLSEANLLTIGDFDADGKVTNRDIQLLLDAAALVGGGSVGAVPEPASFVLLGLGGTPPTELKSQRAAFASSPQWQCLRRFANRSSNRPTPEGVAPGARNAAHS